MAIVILCCSLQFTNSNLFTDILKAAQQKFRNLTRSQALQEDSATFSRLNPEKHDYYNITVFPQSVIIGTNLEIHYECSEIWPLSEYIIIKNNSESSDTIRVFNFASEVHLIISAEFNGQFDVIRDLFQYPISFYAAHQLTVELDHLNLTRLCNNSNFHNLTNFFSKVPAKSQQFELDGASKVNQLGLASVLKVSDSAFKLTFVSAVPFNDYAIQFLHRYCRDKSSKELGKYLVWKAGTAFEPCSQVMSTLNANLPVAPLRPVLPINCTIYLN